MKERLKIKYKVDEIGWFFKNQMDICLLYYLLYDIIYSNLIVIFTIECK